MSMSRPSDYDDLEIDTLPEAKRPPPRRRASNPDVDEQIHTGEIQPRSLIVRSGAQSPLAKPELSVELDRAVAQPEVFAESSRSLPSLAPRRAPWPWLGLAAIAIAGLGVAIVFATHTKSTPHATPTEDPSDRLALQTAAQLLGATIDGDARALLVRAQSYAASPMLRAGILTDARTVEDIARDNDLFGLAPTEIVEVIQIRDGVRTLLLRLPANASALTAPAPGKTTLIVRDGALAVIGTAPIADQHGITGEVVLETPLNIEPVQKQIADHAAAANIVGLAAPIILVKPTPGGVNASFPVPNAARLPLSVDVVLPRR